MNVYAPLRKTLSLLYLRGQGVRTFWFSRSEIVHSNVRRQIDQFNAWIINLAAPGDAVHRADLRRLVRVGCLGSLLSQNCRNMGARRALHTDIRWLEEFCLRLELVLPEPFVVIGSLSESEMRIQNACRRLAPVLYKLQKATSPLWEEVYQQLLADPMMKPRNAPSSRRPVSPRTRRQGRRPVSPHYAVA